MGGVLRAEPLWVETFTGLRVDRFLKLVRVVRERGGNGPGGGRPWCLPLADRVLLVAVSCRTNLTMRQLAPLFGVSPATVCRVIQRLRPLLALEPAPRPVAGVDQLWMVDGTLIPVRDRSVGASSRNYRFSANVQVIIDADTRLVIASARSKNWKILRDCRQKGDGLHHAVQAVATMHNLALAG
ncbi:transposase family protein [Streptomyces sp. B93]|uniref:transposase family protein n=1 Tax=Streptomyces sp. B93 TaxID=2824875 RepID=UPI001B35EED9|nr:transposase family protein [Streptomyces sp. B93]MBQ1090072.1 transposase family protein [Streptomyces sp. B93]